MSKNKPTRIVGIDFGMVRIGLAISDESKILARPLSTITAEKKSEATIQKIVDYLKKIEEELNCQIQEIVVGLPLLMSGKKGLLADEVAHFIAQLKQVISIPIVTWDERLTSVQAERSLRESNLTRKQRTAHVDKVAAIIILQNYLDHHQWTSQRPLDS